MKRLILIAFFIFINSTIYGQKKLKKPDVKEVGFDITMNFQPIVDNITYKGLSINIIPVSADELNSKFLEESFFNGKFKYSHYTKSRESNFLKKKR